MNKWEKFEQDCVEFLNKTYGMYARFTHKGGADSTVPDILVETRQGFCFYHRGETFPGTVRSVCFITGHYDTDISV